MLEILWTDRCIAAVFENPTWNCVGSQMRNA
jgi:hypothetical protein